MTTKLEFLADHPVFADLDDAELLALTQIAQECDFSKDSIIAYQRDVADGMVIVKDGRLYAREVDPQGVVRAANTRQFSPTIFMGRNGCLRREPIRPQLLDPIEGELSSSMVRISGAL